MNQNKNKGIVKNGKYLPTTAWIALNKDNSIVYQNAYPLIYIQKTKPTVMYKDVKYKVKKIKLK